MSTLKNEQIPKLFYLVFMDEENDYRVEEVEAFFTKEERAEKARSVLKNKIYYDEEGKEIIDEDEINDEIEERMYNFLHGDGKVEWTPKFWMAIVHGDIES